MNFERFMKCLTTMTYIVNNKLRTKDQDYSYNETSPR